MNQQSLIDDHVLSFEKRLTRIQRQAGCNFLEFFRYNSEGGIELTIVS